MNLGLVSLVNMIFGAVLLVITLPERKNFFVAIKIAAAVGIARAQSHITTTLAQSIFLGESH